MPPVPPLSVPRTSRKTKGKLAKTANELVMAVESEDLSRNQQQKEETRTSVETSIGTGRKRRISLVGISLIFFSPDVG